MRLLLLPVSAAISLGSGQAALAQTNSWQVIVQPGGYKVARTAMAGRATGLALTCERGKAVIAVSLAQPPRRNPAQLRLRSGAGSIDLAIIRNGATNVWVAPLQNSAPLEMLASRQFVSLSVDGVEHGAASLSGAGTAMGEALAGCWQPAGAVAPGTPANVKIAGNPEEAAVRATVGGIYGWRDGRQVKSLENWDSLFSPSINALIAQCELAIKNADPKANGGEGAYAVTGDQGCQGSPFMLDPVLGDPAPFVPKVRPALRRTAPDTIEVETIIPPAYRKEWGSSEIIRFQRSGGRWLVAEVTTRNGAAVTLYSGQISEMISELRKIAKKTVSSRRR